MGLLQRLPDTEEKKKELVEVIRSMRAPLALLGFPEGSLSFFQMGERLAKELGDAGRLAAIYSGMGTYYSYTGDHLKAIRYTEEGFEESRKAQAIELMAPLAFSLCLSYAGDRPVPKDCPKNAGGDCSDRERRKGIRLLYYDNEPLFLSLWKLLGSCLELFGAL